jgi:3-methyladenine DNA glycosylase AlkD
VLRPLARKLGRDHARAEALWESGIREARLIALFTEEPERVTPAQARRWAGAFASWEIVDHAADLFVDAGLSAVLIPEFAGDESEWIKRCAFAMIAWGAVHRKKASDSEFIALLPLIERHAGDDRHLVRKAASWALRQIGKRSPACHGEALVLARRLAASADRNEAWIGREAARELGSQATLGRLARKAVSRRSK